jgi:hypothetical protein
VTDLAEFLNARLDEDEAAAKAAWGVEWDWRYVAQPFGERPSIAHTVHMARHDPRRVLREAETKKAIIALAFEYEQKIDGEWGCGHNAEEIGAGECRDIKPDGIGILRQLAAVYSDHPDYREEWTPDTT